jgi:hypothetical protein
MIPMRKNVFSGCRTGQDPWYDVKAREFDWLDQLIPSSYHIPKVARFHGFAFLLLSSRVVLNVIMAE